MVQVDGLNKMD